MLYRDQKIRARKRGIALATCRVLENEARVMRRARLLTGSKYIEQIDPVNLAVSLPMPNDSFSETE